MRVLEVLQEDELYPCHNISSLRMQLCKWLRHQYTVDELFLHNVLWTGEIWRNKMDGTRFDWLLVRSRDSSCHLTVKCILKSSQNIRYTISSGSFPSNHTMESLWMNLFPFCIFHNCVPCDSACLISFGDIMLETNLFSWRHSHYRHHRAYSCLILFLFCARIAQSV
jgi:hypothetical protein